MMQKLWSTGNTGVYIVEVENKTEEETGDIPAGCCSACVLYVCQ